VYEKLKIAVGVEIIIRKVEKEFNRFEIIGYSTGMEDRKLAKRAL
jgi:hypothetical protein